MIIRTLVALVLASTCLGAAASQIFKYVDPQGRVHYADQPKPGWQRVGVTPPPAGSAAPEEGETETREQAVARAADCARKEEQLKTYRNASRVIERDALGREKDYSEEDRQRLIQKMEQEIQACKQPPAAPAEEPIQ